MKPSPSLSKCSCILFFALSAILTSCYQQNLPTSDAWNFTKQQMDSISYYTTHHYTQNYNFVVKSDSLSIIIQHPIEVANDMPFDSLTLYHGNRIVVADILTMPADTIDSVWVKVARDQQTIGWIRESRMLPCVAPDDPISQFIDIFSDTHLLIFLAIIVLVAATLIIRRLFRHNAKIVHFNDIDSFYPALLALSVSASAVFYSTIQLFAPDSWRHYYYHPTLNPFSVPLHLGLFLLSVWAIIVIALAAVDDIYRRLPTGQAIVYYAGLAGVCAVDYILFSVSTLYYVGYPLLVLYAFFAVRRYFHNSRESYRCGKCGHLLHEKGICPYCGTENI